MTNRGTLAAATTVLITIAIIQMALAIVSIFFGYYDEDLDCQEGTRGGLNLSDWLKGFGLEKCTLNVLLILSIPLVTYGSDLFLILPGVGLLLDTFFNIIWWIWGVVILATRQNRQCVVDGTDMAIVAIIDLALGIVWYAHLRIAAAVAAVAQSSG